MTQFLIDDAGWVQSAEVIRSPNFDARPDNARIKLIVVHGISLPPGEYGGGYIQEFFCNNLDPAAHGYFESICGMTVSAHCLIERDGSLLQFVSFLDRAWHAGESEWRGVPNVNDYGLGIELVNLNDGQDPYPEAQYQSLVKLCQALAHKHNISTEDIVGHYHIAPGRKTDPRGLDVNKLRQDVAAG